MPKIITFSRTYPSYHPRAGEPTYFVEKIWESLRRCNHEADGWRMNNVYELENRLGYTVSNYALNDWLPKHHTIRAGHRFKAGDKFSPRVWSGKPYRSKMIQFAPDIEVKKVFDFGMRMRCPYKEFYSGNCDLTGNSIVRVAMNDGLTSDDLYWWFQKPFDGQIICWSDAIEY